MEHSPDCPSLAAAEVHRQLPPSPRALPIPFYNVTNRSNMFAHCITKRNKMLKENVFLY